MTKLPRVTPDKSLFTISKSAWLSPFPSFRQKPESSDFPPKEGLILLVIPAKAGDAFQQTTVWSSSAFKLLNAKTLDSCLTSPPTVEKRLAGMTSERTTDQTFPKPTTLDDQTFVC